MVETKVTNSWYNNRSLNQWSADIASWRERKGFTTEWANVMEKLMLVVTELAEAAEAYRKQDEPNFKEEISDALIHLFDLAGSLNIDLEKEIGDKMIYNETRPNKHGKIC